MKALICDICGGKLIMETGRIAICESCGTLHNTEVTKKSQEKSIYANNIQFVDNYLELAKSAYQSENYKEAEIYCNRIIEVDVSHTDALFLKGCAVGWQSTIEKFRFKEAALYFAKAINSSENLDKKTLHLEIENEFKHVATALIQLRCNRFSEWPDQEETNGFENDLNEISDAIKSYERITDLTINKNDVFQNASSVVRICMTSASEKMFFHYKANENRNTYTNYVIQTTYCIRILIKTADLCTNDSYYDVQLFDLAMKMIKTLLAENKTDSIMNKWGAYVSAPRLTPYYSNIIQNQIKEIQSRITAIHTDISSGGKSNE
ncbi:MAG: hypothetical protein LUG91_10925 [Ruminococcus sp.]|nr:hypothetical protein [Ruminococcus sp.]